MLLDGVFGGVDVVDDGGGGLKSWFLRMKTT
jgi:hypothetical protein